ncbi:hypothetical protein BBJ28_00001097 [Nothophytophthora sp. Chile5]|nr:hypothetical protein BBJ28_00001097 [Nothophytophthora sp. Chile5]
MESELPTARHRAASSSRRHRRPASPCDLSSGGTVGTGGRRKTRRGGRGGRWSHRDSTPSLPRDPLATRVVSAEEFLLEMQDDTDNSSKPIPIVLRCRETVEQYEENFERWLGLRSEKVRSDRDEERRLRLRFAELRTNRPAADADSVQLSEAPRAKADSCASGSTTDTESAEKDPPRSFSSPTEEGPDMIDLTEDSRSHEQTLAEIQDRGIQCGAAATGGSQADTEATEPLATTAPERDTAGPTKKRLTTEYVRVHKQIALNETAMEDSLAYVKAMMEVDQGSAAEHHEQIMELCVSINEAKTRRESALAALIAHEWLGRREELERLVRTAATEQCDTRHELFLSICLKLERKEEGILALEGKLKKRLQWMRAADIPSHLQIEELREVSVQLAAEQSMRTNLKRQKREACLGFLKTSEAIHQVVVKMLVDAEKTQASSCSSTQAA